ncbi:MAG: ATP-binding protein [Chitinophagales bacterium]
MIKVSILADFAQSVKTLIHVWRIAKKCEFDLMHTQLTHANQQVNLASKQRLISGRTIKTLWQMFVNTGIDDTVLADEVRYVHFTNIIALLTMVAAASFIPFSVYHAQGMLALKQVMDVACIGIVVWLNYKRHYLLARYAYIFLVNIVLLVNALVLGHATGIHEFFYISYMVPFLLFRVKDYMKIILGLVIVLSFFDIYYNLYPAFAAYNLPADLQHSLAVGNAAVRFGLFGIAIYLLAYYNYTVEVELEKTNRELTEHSMELEQSNADLEQFAYIISHDLKTPVRNISSFLDLLAQRYADKIDQSGMDYINFSRSGAVRLSKQIDSLLVYSRIGKNLPPVSQVNVADVVKGLQLEMQDRIKTTNAVISISKPLPTVNYVHAGLLMQLFRQLLDNALKFNKAEIPSIKIDWCEDDSKYSFSVEDNGIGIDNQYSAKLFNIFRRLHAEGEYEGSGTGLAICKKILNIYKGTIWYDGTPGKGTTFYFTIPKTDPFIQPAQLLTKAA